MEEMEKKKKENKKKELIAKKDFIIKHNELFIKIKKGDKVDVPEFLIQNLKTEKVI